MFRKYRKHGLEKMNNSLFTISSSGISWDQLVIENKEVKGTTK
jgi:hypothetical protein